MHPSFRAIPALNTESQAQAILLVDNSRMFSGMVAATIHERLGLPVTVAASLAEAKQALARDPGCYFLVFTGLVLSDADPDTVLAFFVESGLPMVVVSGVYDEAIRQKVLSRPVVDCVLKNTPGSIDYLVWLAQRLDRNRRIGALVVDDSASARALAATMLRLYGFTVIEAAGGEEALRAVAANPWIRLVIADYEMPEMDGLELTRRLRATCTRDRMSIIGISGAEAPSLVARFLKHGANDFLHKPYSREEFFCRVSQNVDNLDLIGTLQDLATKDFLTGLPNRRHFFDHGGRMFQAEGAAELTTGMLDIDHFKHINDSYGHEAGDIAIRAVANAVAQHVGPRDLPSRFGGEEFAIVASGLLDARVRTYFEQLRSDIEAMDIPLPDGRSIRLTVSIGVCTSGDSLSAMLAEADRQLYVAKAAGRNRVEHAASGAREAAFA
ncbi:diguanylate cyclase [Lysobacter sp. Root494]|uniref:diguanylate cyclase n=1 Tax=Lysobacter sp. Root494 TaxID=1736549 RepID=UPI0006FAC3B1|nr:diguanylate cyclase [Lysobacter sp. Root494]KQY52229.1 diguanylate cyclase [Lysobacter sp. Root494]